MRPTALLGCGGGLNGAEAGVTAHATIYAADRYGNRQVRGGEQFMVELVGPCFVQGVVHDNGDGTYGVTYKATKSGRYHMHVLFNRRLILGSPFSICIKNARTIQNHVAMLGLGFRQAVSGRPTTLRLLALDVFNNPMDRGGESFDIRLTLKQSTSHRVHHLRNSTPYIGEEEIEGRQQKYLKKSGGRFVPPRFDLNCLADNRPQRATKSEDTRHANWENTPKLSGNSLETKYPISLCQCANGGYLNTKGMDLLDLTTTLFREKMNELRRQKQENGDEADEGAPDYEQSSHAGEPFRSLESSLNTKQGHGDHATVITPTVTDCGDGTYNVFYTPTVAGEYSWTIVHNGVDVSPADEVVHVCPGCADEAQCVLHGSGMRAAAAGELANFVVQLADKNGNALKVGGDNVDAEIYKEYIHPDEDKDVVLPLEVTDLEDGR